MESTTFHDGVRARMIHAGGGFGASAVEKMSKIQGLQDLERHWAVMKQYEVSSGKQHYKPGGDRRAPRRFCGRINVPYGSRCIFIRMRIIRMFQGNRGAYHECGRRRPWLRDNPPKFRWGENHDRGQGRYFLHWSWIGSMKGQSF